MNLWILICLMLLSLSIPAQQMKLINNVPDYSQPPSTTLTSTIDSNFCSPFAYLNIIAYWELIQGHSHALGMMAGLSPTVVAEYIGWFMDTNDQGNPGRDNGTGRPSAPGTYGHDQWMGAQEYIIFDSVNTFLYPDTIPTKRGYGWDIQMVPVADFLPLKEELDTYSPVKADFYYWNIIPTGTVPALTLLN